MECSLDNHLLTHRAMEDPHPHPSPKRCLVVAAPICDAAPIFSDTTQTCNLLGTTFRKWTCEKARHPRVRRAGPSQTPIYFARGLNGLLRGELLARCRSKTARRRRSETCILQVPSLVQRLRTR